jgi:hypothetical protein
MFGDFDFFIFGGFELIPKQKAFCHITDGSVSLD